MPTRSVRTMFAVSAVVGLLLVGSACSSGEETDPTAFCEAFEQLGQISSGDPTAIARTDLTPLLESAPTPELRKATETVRDTFASLNTIDLDNLSSDDPRVAREASNALLGAITPEFNEASDRIDDYVEANCATPTQD